MGAWRPGRARFAGALRSGLRWTRGIWGVVAWGGRAPAVPWVAGGLVGAGPWLPVGVGWPGGRRSRRPSSGLQPTSCRGNGGAVWLQFRGAVYDRVGEACGWWRARSAVPFPVSPEPWGRGGDVGDEGGAGVGVGDGAAGGAVGEAGIGVSVVEVGAGIALVDDEVGGSASHCCRCRCCWWCWCLWWCFGR